MLKFASFSTHAPILWRSYVYLIGANLKMKPIKKRYAKIAKHPIARDDVENSTLASLN